MAVLGLAVSHDRRVSTVDNPLLDDPIRCDTCTVRFIRRCCATASFASRFPTYWARAMEPSFSTFQPRASPHPSNPHPPCYGRLPRLPARSAACQLPFDLTLLSLFSYCPSGHTLACALAPVHDAYVSSRNCTTAILTLSRCRYVRSASHTDHLFRTRLAIWTRSRCNLQISRMSTISSWIS